MCMSIDEMSDERVAADLSYMETDTARSGNSFWKWRLPGFQRELRARLAGMDAGMAEKFGEEMRQDGLHPRVLALIAERVADATVVEAAEQARV